MPKHDEQVSGPFDGFKDRLTAMEVGDSFFVHLAKPGDLGFLRRMAKRMNRTLSIRWVLQDTIYGKPGTRVYRVK